MISLSLYTLCTAESLCHTGRCITSFVLCPDEITHVDIVLPEEKVRRHSSLGLSFSYSLKKLLEPFDFEAFYHLGFLDMSFS